MPASWVLIGALIAICVGVATVGAVLLGPHGIQRMNGAEIGLIFPTLGILIWLAAAVSVSEMIPDSQRRMPAWVLPAAGSVVLVAVFAVLFRDYRTEHFVAQCVTCLTAGLLHAIPTALASWWILHRGFAVNSRAAALAQGSVAGRAGVSMLELHCVNFEAPHVMLWHTAVLPLSGGIWALLVWGVRSLRNGRV
jgi:hypothetical protein